MTHREKVAELLKQKYHCSQALLGAFAGDFGLDIRTVFKISTGFGNDLWQGGTCGCITGGLLVMELAFGFTDSQGRASNPYNNRKAEEYIRIFRERMRGDLYCRNFPDGNRSTAGALTAVNQEELILPNCSRAFQVSIEILEKMLEEYEGELLSMNQEETDLEEEYGGKLSGMNFWGRDFEEKYDGELSERDLGETDLEKENGDKLSDRNIGEMKMEEEYGGANRNIAKRDADKKEYIRRAAGIIEITRLQSGVGLLFQAYG